MKPLLQFKSQTALLCCTGLSVLAVIYLLNASPPAVFCHDQAVPQLHAVGGRCLGEDEDIAHSLPAEFDPVVYRRQYPDVAAFQPEKLARHYKEVGSPQGRRGFSLRNRADFVALADNVANSGKRLEIGPFHAPLYKGKNVRYFDVLSAEDLRKRSKAHGGDPSGTCLAQ
jgi:hypothetical protein